jgi:hypothetical protein
MGKTTDDSSEPRGRSDSTWSLLRWIEALKKSDQMFYNMMMIEIWSIAQTMDELNPGFWADYMQNRQLIMQQQIEERKRRERDSQSRASARKSSIPRRPFSPMNLMLDAPRDEPIEMVSLFSQSFEQELSKVKQSVNLTPSHIVNLSSLDPNAPAANASSTDLENFLAVYPRRPLATSRELSGFPDAVSATIPSPLSTTEQRVIPEGRSIYQQHIIELPHLLHAPVLKVLPSTPIHQDGLFSGGQWTTIIIGCWLTRRFLMPTSLGDGKLFVLKRLDVVDLEPGQPVICQLGFRLHGITTPIQVKLVKSLQKHSELTADWANPSELSTSSSTATEVGVRVLNSGTQPYRLTAGQAFCRLEFHHLFT